MFELVCIDLVNQTKKVVMAFEHLSDALAAEREYQRLSDQYDKQLEYKTEKVTV